MLASATFQIPLAVDARGRLVPPEEATRAGRYRCPCCDGAIDLHAGEKKRWHFHHRVAVCAVETVLHLSAKRCIVQAIEDWHAGVGPAPAFLRRCSAAECSETSLQSIPKKVVRAREELRLRSGHVVDVGLLGVGDLPVAAIEVLVSHAVDREKATELGVPWIEVAAADVCAGRGLVLTPLRDRFIPWLCAEHAGQRGEAARETRETRALRNRLVRALPYRVEDFAGFHVAGVTRCPSGHDTVVLGWEGREPPWPRPPHVVATARDEDAYFDSTQSKTRRVLGFRRRWASTCTRCNAVVAEASRKS